MFTGSLPLRFFYREILLANSAQKTCSSVGYTSKIRRILDAWQQTHNLEVPGSSPGWSTQKNRPNGGSFLLQPVLSPAGYLLRLWFAPTSLTTNPQSMGLYETNLKPRLVHKKRIAQMAVLFCVISLCFVNKCSLLTRNSSCLKRINEVIVPILSFIIDKNVIFVSVINRN